MAQFRTVKQLNTYLSVIVEEILMKISSDVEEKVLKLVKERIYTNGMNMAGFAESDSYERTWDFLASVTRAEPKFSNGRVEVEIYYDSNKIMPQQGNGKSEWNSHIDINGNVDNAWDGKSIPELLPLWMEYGTSRGLAPRGGIHVMEDVYDELKKTYKQEFIKELKKYGIKSS